MREMRKSTLQRLSKASQSPFKPPPRMMGREQHLRALR
jgi:hypothetical protein